MLVVTIVVGLAVVAVIVAAVVIVLSRRSHLRSWKIGLFFESEERFDDDRDE